LPASIGSSGDPSSGPDTVASMSRQAYVLEAERVGWHGVRRRIAVSSDQTFLDLHEALMLAFDWDEEHLFSFWTSGDFWARTGDEYVHPLSLQPDPLHGYFEGETATKRSALERLDRAGLSSGQRIAYVFDYGDEWRVELTLRDVIAADGDPYPRILARRGESPPQYRRSTKMRPEPAAGHH
jgi:hypothetical protein